MTSYNYLTLPVPAQFCSDAWLTYNKGKQPQVSCMYVIENGEASPVTISAIAFHHMHIKWISALYAYIEMKVREHAKSDPDMHADNCAGNYIENYATSNHLS